MTRLGVAAGAHPLTFAGLAGVGDLIATCMSPLSRNRRAGELMALRACRGPMRPPSSTAWPKGSTRFAARWSWPPQHGVELPIAEQVAAVVHDAPPADAGGRGADGARAQGRAGRDAGMSGLRVRVSLGVASLVSLVTGAILLAVGSVFRQRRTVAAGKRRFHGKAFERRWIPDDAERQVHADVVAERLGQSPSEGPVVRVAEAAERLGVSVSTVRRRVQRGELQAVMEGGRMTGVILEAD